MLTRHRLHFLVASLVIALLLGAGGWVAASAGPSTDGESMFKHLAVFTDALRLMRQAYVEEPDLDMLMAGAYEGAADALDPFSVYVPAADVKRFLAARDQGFPRTGLFLLRERGWVYVAGVADGGPAAAAGLERGDLVSRIAGESTRNLSAWEIEARIAQAEGPVELEILRRGEAKALALAPGPFSAGPVARTDERGVPVLRVARFEDGVVEAVRGALQEIANRGGDRLLIDLRGVAGGDEELAFAVGDLFVDGPLGTLRRKGEVRERYADARPAVWSGRTAVMVDGGTLGAAEVLAAVLGQGAGAKVVGEETFGHAGHMDLVSLSSGGLLELTDAFYAGPSEATLNTGLVPDVEVRDLSRRIEERELEFDELILQRALDTLAEETAPEEKVAA